jgi:lysophospholipase L1-like esterase
MNSTTNQSRDGRQAREPFLLALGDCNTEGLADHQGDAFPVAVAAELGVPLVNCGHTMSTVREGWEYARRRLTPDTRYLLVQYGLVDSWLTFRGAPYVLYYPDSPLRGVLRKLVKKYKKVGRRLKFGSIFGAEHVVAKAEYEQRLMAIIQRARQLAPDIHVCLISTAPSQQEFRNPAIQQFNAIMARVAQASGCQYVDVYSQFVGRPELFLDLVHLTREGHAIIARACLAALPSSSDDASPMSAC